MTWFLILIVSLSVLLALFDMKEQKYPLIFWIFLTIPLLITYPINMSFIIFIILAIVSYFISLGFGAGDFLYLSSMALLFNTNLLLLLLHISCLLGIIYCIIWKQGRIPFIPFLVTAFFIVIWL